MTDRLSQTFAALADPTRRALLARLAQGQANVSELAQPFLDRMSLPAITKHLKVLERAGLVNKSREAQRRPCELQTEPLKDAAQWMATYRQFWEESLDRLGDYLDAVADGSTSAGDQATSKQALPQRTKEKRSGRKPASKKKSV